MGFVVAAAVEESYLTYSLLNEKTATAEDEWNSPTVAGHPTSSEVFACVAFFIGFRCIAPPPTFLCRVA